MEQVHGTSKPLGNVDSFCLADIAEDRLGPAILPCNRRDLQGGLAGNRVVRVEDDQVAFRPLQYRLSARPDLTAICSHEFTAAALEHFPSYGIDIRPGHAARTSDHRAITTVNSAAAEIE